jgi:hypothetical protein
MKGLQSEIVLMWAFVFFPPEASRNLLVVFYLESSSLAGRECALQIKSRFVSTKENRLNL